ncbi:uncharacterized protein RCC_08639 [Ramularia collo-cygni]|uniref:Uncharacterized protein n=1 Tax=Ramularia collo-cygni TaxID=112498 RepID=A0A2D3VFN1_9PEZI|nr:uncharacterized protein RCC_08639 [Ramularia collo-cygni]CZT22931.1 uncharacterized protein RCC_08639 [Ramularia collo-cygni]
MTDNLRQGAGDKLASAAKPESQKGVVEKATDAVKSAGDSVAGTAQPESQKSVGQKASDTVSGTGASEKDGKGLLEQAGDALGLNNNNKP